MEISNNMSWKFRKINGKSETKKKRSWGTSNKSKMFLKSHSKFEKKVMEHSSKSWKTRKVMENSNNKILGRSEKSWDIEKGHGKFQDHIM